MIAMPLTLAKKRFLFNYVDQISQFFHFSQEIAFLSQFVPEEQLQNCAAAGESNRDQLEELMSLMVWTKNNDLYLAMLHRFLEIRQIATDVVDTMWQTCAEEERIYENSVVPQIHDLERRKNELMENLNVIDEKIKQLMTELHHQQELDEGEDSKETTESNQQLSRLHSFPEPIYYPPSKASKPFPQKPSAAIDIVIQRYVQWGWPALVYNECGCYPEVDWTLLPKFPGRQDSWQSQWASIKDKVKGPRLAFPVIVLPPQLQALLIAFYIEWQDKLVLRGWIINQKFAPLCMQLPLKIKILLNGKTKWTQHETVTIRREVSSLDPGHLNNNDPNSVWTISHGVNKKWNLPTVKLKVSPLK